MKKCTQCKIEKPLDQFYARKERGGRGISECKRCNSRRSGAIYRKNKPDRLAKRKAHYKRNKGYHYLRTFGITLEQYHEILMAQQERCAICKIHYKECRVSMAVDHCHKTGVIRGLLCDRCNRGLGFLKESVEVLVAAIKYIKKTEDLTLLY